jgi:hypothetical protein
VTSYKIDIMPGPLYFHIKIEQLNPGDGANPVWRFEAPKDQFAPVTPVSELHQVSAFLEGAFWSRLTGAVR